ncbi:hypothetical protein [Fictibacillus fluitans]|uniref:Uncharacterized protein n=1 Tax=Fictibacillus fluitans TaxID=3058422 RepID=A0ABT8HQZ3_9BACL|nr:hypothetical protein [Fictibacillus sp. NE201]MDN4523174.1 hypothetical protein [Fictibacillus sp. NE201]
MTKRKRKTTFKKCIFVGEGQEDIRDILRRQFVKEFNRRNFGRDIALQDEQNSKKRK